MSSSNRVTPELRAKILADVRSGASKRETARLNFVDEKTVRRVIIANGMGRTESQEPRIVYNDKKTGGLNWRDATKTIMEMQKLYSSASRSQTHASVEVGNGVDPIALMLFSDSHISARGTDHAMLVELTDMIVNVPNLYVCLDGDLGEYALKLRSISEVCSQLLDPHMQSEFIESWFDEISHKVISASFGNHDVERSQHLSGESVLKNMLSDRVVYFDGIGHLDVKVGTETYKIAISHRFSGSTQLDPTAGCRKYMRFQAPDREIALQGDLHNPKIEKYTDGSTPRCAMTAGTLNVNSGYAKRWFSLYTNPAFPVVCLQPNTHAFTPYFCVQEYLTANGLEAGNAQ